MCPQALLIALAIFLMSCPFRYTFYLYYGGCRIKSQGVWEAILTPLDKLLNARVY